MFIKEFRGGMMTVTLHRLDCEKIARVCAIVCGGDSDVCGEGIDQLGALFTFGALACALYGQTAGDDKEDASAAALLARIGG